MKKIIKRLCNLLLATVLFGCIDYSRRTDSTCVAGMRLFQTIDKEEVDSNVLCG